MKTIFLSLPPFYALAWIEMEMAFSSSYFNLLFDRSEKEGKTSLLFFSRSNFYFAVNFMRANLLQAFIGDVIK